MTVSEAARSPVSQEVSAELERVVGRWRQLPLDRALSYAGLVRELAQSLADGVAHATGVHASVIPDLGPATLMDQLTVMVYDASAAGATRTLPGTTAGLTAGSAAGTSAAGTSAAGTSTLVQDLVKLRRELH